MRPTGATVIPWELVTFVVGVLYGWLSPGRQDKMAIFKKGLIIGLVLALVFALLGALLKVGGLGFLGSGAIGIILSMAFLTLIFILGVWLGDLIEGATKKKTA